MARAKMGKEISIRLGNVRGTGAQLFGKLKEAGVNVVASCCYQIGDEATFTIVPDDIDRASALLVDEAETRTQDVLLLELPNEPGALAKVLVEISMLGVDVRSAYATSGGTKKSALAVLKTEDDERVLEALADGGDEDEDAN